MILSEAELTNGPKRSRGKTRIGSRNVVLWVGMWVTGYELSTRYAVATLVITWFVWGITNLLPFEILNSSVILTKQRTCEANLEGKNSSFILHEMSKLLYPIISSLPR